MNIVPLYRCCSHIFRMKKTDGLISILYIDILTLIFPRDVFICSKAIFSTSIFTADENEDPNSDQFDE